MQLSVASDLVLHCLLMSQKKDARLIWDEILSVALSDLHKREDKD